MKEKTRVFLRDPLQRLGAIPDYLSLTKPQTYPEVRGTGVSAHADSSPLGFEQHQ